MYEWSRGNSNSNINDKNNNSDGGGVVTSEGNVDILAEEKISLRLILDTLNDTLDHKYAKRRQKDNSNNSNNNNSNNNGVSFSQSSSSSRVIATDVEMVELLGMLPRVLQGAVAPAAMKEKEHQRELMASYNIPRSPPFSRYTILYHLLFSPLSSPSSSHTLLLLSSSSSSFLSPSTGESEVLNCIARVFIYSCGSGSRESSLLLRQSNLHRIVTTNEGAKPTISGDSITMASLHSLGDILHLSLNNSEEEEEERGSVCRTQLLLRDALRHALSESGLYEYLWRSLLFHPLPDVLRAVMGQILRDVSHFNLLGLPAIIVITRQSITPAVWGERVAQCILSDSSPNVKESLVMILHEGLVEAISADKKSSHFIHWKRWMTNTSLKYLLGVLSIGAPVSVLQPLLATLMLALEVELKEDGRELQRSVGPMWERFHLMTVVEVCTTKLVYLFTGPNAVNRRIWTSEDDVELISYRLLVSGLVQLLRLALKGVDVLLCSLNHTHRSNSNNSNNNNNAVKEAILILRTCVEKQLVAVLLKCLEEQYQQKQQQVSSAVSIYMFSTGKIRAEMIRLLRDLTERATPPLFFLMGKFIPYFPMMMQSILSGAGKAEFPFLCNCKQQQQQKQQYTVCSEEVEMIVLFGVLLCYSSQMREGFLQTFSILQCTWEQCQAVFDVLEATARSLPEHTVEGLLWIDGTGTLIHRMRSLLQSKSVECLFHHQEEKEEEQEQEQREKIWISKGSAMDCRNNESRWVSIQQERQKVISQKSHIPCDFVYRIFHYLRRSIMKRMNDDIKRKEEKEKEEEVDGVSLSPIQPSTSASTGSTKIAIVGNTHEEDMIAVVEDLKKKTDKKNNNNNKRHTGQEGLVTPHSTVEKWNHQKLEENVLFDDDDDSTENSYDLHSLVHTHSSLSTGQREEEEEEREWQMKKKTSLVMIPPSTDLNMHELLRRVRYSQMETSAAEEKVYHAALDLFAALASRYYRHILTPQAAVEYLKRHEHKGWPPHSHITTTTSSSLNDSIQSVVTGRKNYNTILRLWTGRDVRKEDLFFFSLPIKEINEEAIITLIDRCKKHKQTLRRVLRTTPQTLRGRRWFLEDAITNIMGRLIALFHILLLSIQQEGEKAVQEVFTRMPEVGDREMILDSVAARCMWTGDAIQQELHCGTIIDMTKFIVSCFSLPVNLTV
ncbi:uncharacterized protein TM35_000152520 [Trypanosoma theileri]|uniref:Uncharacterized protein n=1 Tax=Trypanosoma theileri TaxID=67003 RepID=A0A1X0NW30_9TRYP|nr:uncharacterized protein TM35_000152520 [Trypanosoma theileri]ORC88821.1 hypothetical protein TM35_000152520 [Trypanosoma theileri]